MNKAALSNFLRKIGLIYLADLIWFRFQKLKHRKANKLFKNKYPEVKLPPDYLIFESFQMHYHNYYIEGRDSAQWLIDHIKRHIDLKDKKILDWGCGPARIIRHLPELIANNCSYYGTDYNADSINWCKENLKGINFNLNKLEAQLPYDNDFFDVIYGLSIFTHLSEKMHFDWFNELYRVLKPGGIMFVTTQGDNYISKLTDEELDEYNKGNIVVRGKVKEGHRTYSAFHPKEFMHKMTAKTQILEHIERKPEGAWVPQDIWILKK